VTPGGVEWGPAVGVLLAGLLIGALILAWLRRRTAGVAAASAGVTALPARDLEGKVEALVRQLRELDEQDAKRNPEQLLRERHALELAAARAWRELDALSAGQPAQVAPAVARTAAATPASALAGFLWGAGSMAALGLLVFSVYQSAAPREASRQLTGNVPETEGAGPAPMTAPDANDLESRLDAVRQALVAQDMMAVFNQTKAILERWPGEPRALAYQAAVRLAMGQADVAETMLKQAIAAAPDFIDARVQLMLVYAETGRMTQAQAALDEAVARHPDRSAQLKEIFAEIKKRPVRTAASDGGPNPHASAVPPPAAAAAGPASTRRIAGVLELDPKVARTLSPGAVVFVFVREAGFGAGPPIAARRLPLGAFPMSFEVSASDSMRGEALPDSLLVEARIDADGDPITRPPTDPYARQDDVRTGTTDVRLVLKPRTGP
jgi:tetratricopeptide (TPR) repeat protein